MGISGYFPLTAQSFTDFDWPSSMRRPTAAAALYAITEVAWFDLRSEEHWEASIFDDRISYAMVQEVRRALGYL